MSNPHPIISDAGPGQDDAVAILLALASPELEVLGITAVAGTVPLALTELNARKICEVAGRAHQALLWVTVEVARSRPCRALPLRPLAGPLGAPLVEPGPFVRSAVDARGRNRVVTVLRRL